MNIDQLRMQWAEQGRKLDTLLRLNRAALREARLSSARRILAWSGVLAGAEVAVTVALQVFLAAFIARHWAVPRLAVSAAALFAAAIPFVALQARHLVLLSAMDYGAPVLALQKRLEALHIAQSTAGLWALGAGAVLWPLGAIVLAKAAWDVDLTRIDLRVAAANVAVGCVIAAIVWRFRDRPALRDQLAGRTLASARARLADLARFESET